MTVALGILTRNAQIIAADTQMSTDTEKVSEGKIATHIEMAGNGSHSGVIVITGAGDAALLQSLQDDIGELFMKEEFVNTESESMGEFRAAAETLLKKFYKDYVAICPDPAQRPNVDLIVAAKRGVSSGMWLAHRNRLDRVSSHAAVGIGASHAEHLLGSMTLPQDSETAMLLAAYVVFLVKARNLWVGGDTHVRCIERSTRLTPRSFDGFTCRKLEEVFRDYISVEARMLHRVLGSVYDFCEPDGIARDIETLRKEVADIIHPISATSSDNPQT